MLFAFPMGPLCPNVRLMHWLFRPRVIGCVYPLSPVGDTVALVLPYRAVGLQLFCCLSCGTASGQADGYAALRKMVPGAQTHRDGR